MKLNNDTCELTPPEEWAKQKFEPEASLLQGDFTNERFINFAIRVRVAAQIVAKFDDNRLTETVALDPELWLESIEQCRDAIEFSDAHRNLLTAAETRLLVALTRYDLNREDQQTG